VNFKIFYNLNVDNLDLNLKNNCVAKELCPEKSLTINGG